MTVHDVLPADPLPDLHRPRGPRLAGLSVVLTRRSHRIDLDAAVRRAHLAAPVVADDHEVVVLDRSHDLAVWHPGARVVPVAGETELPAAASAARKEWIVLADAHRAAALGGLGRCLAAAVDHAIVLGRRVGAPAPDRAPARRATHALGLVPRASRRRAPDRTEEFPFVLLRRDLARRLGVVAGSHLPAADLAVLAVLLDARAAIVRVHDRPACGPPARPAGVARYGARRRRLP
ncbi:MAG TPA: hypothetical protein VLB47_11790 [Solirubrobacteraceae bacterium]|nr:hypothetical protein [Solirubrobacteraceae bacterium]